MAAFVVRLESERDVNLFARAHTVIKTLAVFQPAGASFIAAVSRTAAPEPSVLVLRNLGRLRKRYGLPVLVSVSRIVLPFNWS